MKETRSERAICACLSLPLLNWLLQTSQCGARSIPCQAVDTRSSRAMFVAFAVAALRLMHSLAVLQWRVSVWSKQTKRNSLAISSVRENHTLTVIHFSCAMQFKWHARGKLLARWMKTRSSPCWRRWVKQNRRRAQRSRSVALHVDHAIKLFGLSDSAEEVRRRR